MQQLNKKDITKTNIFKKNVKKIDLNPIGLNAICFVEDVFKITEHSTKLIFNIYTGQANYNNQNYEFVIIVDSISKNKNAIMLYNSSNLHYIALCRSTLKLQNKRKIYYIYNTLFNLDKKNSLIYNFMEKISALKNNIRIHTYAPINLEDTIQISLFDMQELFLLSIDSEILIYIDRYYYDIVINLSDTSIKIYRSNIAFIL